MDYIPVPLVKFELQNKDYGFTLSSRVETNKSVITL